MIDSTEYVNLTHWLPGSSTSTEEQFDWRFRSHHTFCVDVEPGRWKVLGKELRGVVERAVEVAKGVDRRFLGHEGGKGEGG